MTGANVEFVKVVQSLFDEMVVAVANGEDVKVKVMEAHYANHILLHTPIATLSCSIILPKDGINGFMVF